MAAPLRITVLPGGLLLDERAPARADAAIAELAELLHGHVIGALTVNAGGDVEAWRNFLLLLGRSPDAVRAEGGIARRLGDHRGPAPRAARNRLRAGAARRIGRQARLLGTRSSPTVFRVTPSISTRRPSSRSSRSRVDSDKLAELMVELETRAVAEGGTGGESRGAAPHAPRHRRSRVQERARQPRAGAAQHGGGRRPAHARHAPRAAVQSRRARRRPPLDGRRRQPDVGHHDLAVRLPQRHRFIDVDRSPGAGVPDARQGARKIASGCSHSRRRTSPSRRSATPRASKASGRTSRRSCSPPTATSRSYPTSTGESCRARGRRRSKSNRSATTPRSGSAPGSRPSRQACCGRST